MRSHITNKRSLVTFEKQTLGATLSNLIIKDKKGFQSFHYTIDLYSNISILKKVFLQQKGKSKKWMRLLKRGGHLSTLTFHSEYISISLKKTLFHSIRSMKNVSKLIISIGALNKTGFKRWLYAILQSIRYLRRPMFLILKIMNQGYEYSMREHEDYMDALRKFIRKLFCYLKIYGFQFELPFDHFSTIMTSIEEIGSESQEFKNLQKLIFLPHIEAGHEFFGEKILKAFNSVHNLTQLSLTCALDHTRTTSSLSKLISSKSLTVLELEFQLKSGLFFILGELLKLTPILSILSLKTTGNSNETIYKSEAKSFSASYSSLSKLQKFTLDSKFAIFDNCFEEFIESICVLSNLNTLSISLTLQKDRLLFMSSLGNAIQTLATLDKLFIRIYDHEPQQIVEDKLISILFRKLRSISCLSEFSFFYNGILELGTESMRYFIQFLVELKALKILKLALNLGPSIDQVLKKWTKELALEKLIGFYLWIQGNEYTSLYEFVKMLTAVIKTKYVGIHVSKKAPLSDIENGKIAFMMKKQRFAKFWKLKSQSAWKRV